MDLKPGELYQGLTGLISGHGGQKTGLRVLVWVLNGPRGGTEGRTEGRKDGRLEIHPCVLQDIGPLGPLPKKGGGPHCPTKWGNMGHLGFFQWSL